MVMDLTGGEFTGRLSLCCGCDPEGELGEGCPIVVVGLPEGEGPFGGVGDDCEADTALA